MDGEEAENETPAVSESGRRRPVSIPNDMTSVSLKPFLDGTWTDNKNEYRSHVVSGLKTWRMAIQQTNIYFIINSYFFEFRNKNKNTKWRKNTQKKIRMQLHTR